MNLKQKTVENTFIVFVVTFFNRGINFLTKIILARLLLPEDFGLIAIASLIIEAIALFREMGIESALIYKKDHVKEAADTTFIILPIVATVLYGIIYVAAHYVAIFYGNDAIASITRISAITLIILSLGSVQFTLLSKDLDFKRRMTPEFVSSIVYALTTVSMAFLGLGVWSMVYGGVLSSFSGLITVWKVSSFRPTFTFNKKLASELIDYGKYILGSSVVIFILANLDDAVVGKILGLTALGYYSMAYSIGNLPATNITHVLGKILFPTYSVIQNEKKKLSEMFLKTFSYVSLLSVPMAFGLFTLSPDFIEFILGKKWLPAVPALKVMCVYGLLRSLNATTGGLFVATGNAKFQRDVSIIQMVFFILLVVPVTQRYGLVGVSVLVTLIMGFLAFGLSMRKVSEITGIRKTHIINALRAPAFASFVSAVFVLIIRQLIHRSLMSLIVEAGVFVFAYILVIRIIDKKMVKEITGLLKDFKLLQ